MTLENPWLDTGSHDLPVSEALAAFMRTGWQEAPPADPAPVPAAPWAARRRAALAARFPGERLVVPAGLPAVRSNDCDHPFRPHSAFSYLTGAGGPGEVLVIDRSGAATLFLHPRPARADTDEFYRDRRHGEFWTGGGPSLAEAEAAYGIACAPLSELPAALAGGAPSRVLRGVDPRVDRAVRKHLRRDADDEFAAYLAEMRLVKDEWEVAELRRAVDATVRGFEDVARALPAAMASPRGERYVEGVFGLLARLEGNATGYPSIVAAGSHACVLHWTRNDGPVREGDLLLLDAGVETDSLYTADVTRTLPASGRFSPVQRQVYELVYEAQQAAIATLKPGARFRDFHLAAMRVIAEGLHEWGVLKQTPERSLAPEEGLYRRYTLCSSGHMLGLDVHDCARARAETYLDGVLAAGNVLTVEPGLYFQPDDLTVPPEFRGIGVRIEDDLLITPDGPVLLSAALPRHPAEVESWLAGLT
ncbi:Xaa-Pro aminopeptidase [Thermocatellispora tengchongensis]|uniref:Xaa-Pro aminopeptidase n=1 Tax=Thermocatellispora tengchongensis TaxID=1073253 RepID=A0A840NT07_9ACTN|nr:aminopeptidase P family protein [Thermocatellispora tengchongensis]MBB5131834.1 Xaa-Pro aminopeptidase [Thermocatellispora tengchongensis]